MIALTRTCAIGDFYGCASPAVWQQRLAEEAYQRWWPQPEADLHAEHLLLNLSGAFFQPLPEVEDTFRSFTTSDDFLRYTPRTMVASMAALMVLDRIEAPLVFLKRVAEDLMPGGLFLATAAYWDAEGDDIATGHDVRQRIYNRISWRKLIVEAERCGLALFGGVDWTYHGHALGDHTLASVVLTKGAPR